MFAKTFTHGSWNPPRSTRAIESEISVARTMLRHHDSANATTRMGYRTADGRRMRATNARRKSAGITGTT